MSTNDFFYILGYSLLGLAIVLGICAPIIIATINKTRPTRELRRENDRLDDYVNTTSALLADLYVSIKQGSTVVDRTLEDRILDLRAQANDLTTGSYRRELT